MVEYLSFHNSSFALKILLKCKWQGHGVIDTPLVNSFCATFSTSKQKIRALGTLYSGIVCVCACVFTG